VGDLCSPEIISNLVFMIDQEKFSKIYSEEKSLAEIILTLKQFLKGKGIDGIANNHEALENRDRNECIDFLFDLIALIKTFNPEVYKFQQELLDEEIKIYLDEIVKYSEAQLTERMNENIKSKSITNMNQIEIQQEMEENLMLKEQIETLKEEKKVFEKENSHLVNQLISIEKQLNNQTERYKLIELDNIERTKEYLEECEKREETHEQMKRYEMELKTLKEACARYAIEEENFEKILNKKDAKINKYLKEMEEHEKTINIYELQMKEFAKIITQYKNEKDEFVRRKEFLAALKKNNNDKNQMLYYFSHKNFQLGVEKQKLDQYIKLCQYQIQKLTTENKSLKHENQVLKTLNQNLLELGGGTNNDPNKSQNLGLEENGKYSTKFVTILKENIRVR
jgi:hypothetical protein